MPEKRSATRGAVNILVAFALLSTILFTGCPLLSDAKGKIMSKSVKDDVRIVNSELDYGITINVVIKNVGKDGTIRVNPALSCSDGEWERTQNLHFKAQETKSLTYFFPEPTINASNCYYGIGVMPKASE